MRNRLTCIIPFYNETDSILEILSELSNIKNITQFICVDDGSANKLSEKIQKRFSKALLIKLDKNYGKSIAVKIGLEKVNEEDIILFDADLKNVKKYEVEKAIEIYFSKNFNLLIMKNLGDNKFIDGIFRKDILQSGKRIISKQDLNNIFSNELNGFELEVAINKYMIDNNKKIGWVENSAYNLHK
ncbi:MAG: glycosyltransferase [Patescibacteria group bacterium]|jgi:glycosyltransferase involved in cell wall biosynthesis